jgi:benzoate membrane transport protein
MAVPADREAALITFLVTASGMSFLGLSAAFWGLIFGISAHLLLGLRKPTPVLSGANGRKEQPAR